MWCIGISFVNEEHVWEVPEDWRLWCLFPSLRRPAPAAAAGLSLKGKFNSPSTTVSLFLFLPFFFIHFFLFPLFFLLHLILFFLLLTSIFFNKGLSSFRTSVNEWSIYYNKGKWSVFLLVEYSKMCTRYHRDALRDLEKKKNGYLKHSHI